MNGTMLWGKNDPPLKEEKKFDTNLPSTHLYLAPTYHDPNEAMRVSENFPQKNL